MNPAKVGEVLRESSEAHCVLCIDSELAMSSLNNRADCKRGIAIPHAVQPPVCANITKLYMIPQG